MNFSLNQPISEAFPELYMLAVNPLMSVKEAGRWDGLVWIWEPSDWIKDFSDGETYLLDLLQQQLFHHKPLLAGADSFIWEDGNEGVFSVYSCVEEIRRRGEEVMQPASVLRRLDFMWKLKVPSKVSIFAWRFILDRLPTRDILQRRGILSGNNDSGCALCFSFLESSAHLFDQCFYSTKVWEKVGNWLGVLDRLNIEELKYFGDNFDKIRTGEERLMVGIVWMAVIWTLWTTRNAILFNGQVFNFDECFTAIVLACWKWFRVLNGSSKDCNFHYWNTLPPSCIKSLEKLNWRAPSGIAKVTGTILGLAGALLLTFYKGVEFEIWPFQINLLDPTNNELGPITEATSELLGVLCVVISCFCFSIWLIIQAKISEIYPCPQSSIALMSVIGTIQCFILGFIVERDLDQWKFGWDIRLLTVAFSGILGSGIMYLVMAWVIQAKGPLYTAAFNPLMLLFVTVVASMILDEKLNLGSILGGVLIVCGLYTVLWGKGKETQKKIIHETFETAGDTEATTPLLSP